MADRNYEPTIGISSKFPQHTFHDQSYLSRAPHQTLLVSVGDYYMTENRDDQNNLLYYGAIRDMDDIGSIEEFRMSAEGLYKFLTNLDNYERSSNVLINYAQLSGWADSLSPLPENYQLALQGDTWGWFQEEWVEQAKNPHTWNAVGLAVAGSLPRVPQRIVMFERDWIRASLKTTIDKVAPNSIGVKTNTGKTLYLNSETGIQVVYDHKWNYIRIENTNITTNRKYLDLDGNIPNNIIVNGKTSGLGKNEYQHATHFKNTDE